MCDRIIARVSFLMSDEQSGKSAEIPISRASADGSRRSIYPEGARGYGKMRFFRPSSFLR